MPAWLSVTTLIRQDMPPASGPGESTSPRPSASRPFTAGAAMPRAEGTFGATLVLLSKLIAAATQDIGDNVGRAFSLVGALSLLAAEPLTLVAWRSHPHEVAS